MVTGLYALLVPLCIRRSRRDRSGPARAGSDPLLWRLLACCLLCLGLNKQLDLQSPLLSAAKHMVDALGLYEQRWLLRKALLGAAGILLLLGGLVLLPRVLAAARDTQIAMLGLGGLGTFVLLRAIKFNRLHEPLGLGWSQEALLEPLSLLLILTASIPRRSRP